MDLGSFSTRCLGRIHTLDLFAISVFSILCAVTARYMALDFLRSIRVTCRLTFAL